MKQNRNTTVDMSKVKKIYHGTKGCCCGCNGPYYYPEDFDDPDARRVVRKVENGKGEFNDGGSYQCLEQRGHYYIVYYD